MEQIKKDKYIYPCDEKIFEIVKKRWLSKSILRGSTSEEVIKKVIEEIFIASLLKEEGRYFRKSFVFKQHNGDLSSGLRRQKWHKVMFAKDMKFNHNSIAKLSPALAEDDYFIVETREECACLTGIARSPTHLFERGSAPIIVVNGPGDLVFMNGDQAFMRYRAGEVIELRHDSIPDSIIMEWARLISSNHCIEIRSFIDRLVKDIDLVGRGGILAFLSPGEEEKYKINPDKSEEEHKHKIIYIEPLEYGKAIVDFRNKADGVAYLEQQIEYARQVKQIDQEKEDSLPRWKMDVEIAYNMLIDFSKSIARMSAVDGAILITADLKVLGSATKFPFLRI